MGCQRARTRRRIRAKSAKRSLLRRWTRSRAKRRRKKRVFLLYLDVSGAHWDLHSAGKFVAIDCEMVGVGPGGEESALARVSLVNYNGAVLLDTFVQPQETVTDYRTHVSGVTPALLKAAMPFKEAQETVAALIQDRILIGHAVHNDLKALMLVHPKLLIRDTQKYKAFRDLSKGRPPSLKMLVKSVLKMPIQSGSHSSVEDARFTLALYKHVKSDWEKHFGSKRGREMKRLLESQKRKTTERKRHDKAAVRRVVQDDQGSSDENDENDDQDTD
ncbi:ribonuclease H-like domain-containing protein [Gongronella butleri]|nr:ribonuclease H-like domain-containing protein [Gongronella butleri]